MGLLPIDLDRLLAEERVPDPMLRAAIRGVLRLRLWQEREPDERAQQARLERWVRVLKDSPICVEQDAANDQHYEVPARFYELVLGDHLKYSCGLWLDGPPDPDALTRAEEDMLALTAMRALVAGGLRVLDLGCGWGSFSLYAAARSPSSEFVAVSNSAPMPSAELLLRFQRDLVVEESWRVDGTHYAKTCEAWLQRLDQRQAAVEDALAPATGRARARAARANWRVFFLACAELFAYGKGREWFVCHWRFAKR